MKRQTIITILLALVAVAGLAKTKTAEVKADSLLLFVQAGDSCMQQYNTFEALKYYHIDACPRHNDGTGTDKDSNCHWLFTRTERRHAGVCWYQ